MVNNLSSNRTKQSDYVGQPMHRFNGHNARRGGYNRNALSGISKEFRVVRDNRVNQNTNKEIKPVLRDCSTSNTEQAHSTDSGEGTTGQKLISEHNLSQFSNGSTDPQPKPVLDANSSGANKKEVLEEKRVTVPNAISGGQAGKPDSSQLHATADGSNSSVVGLCTSRDPVHVPSADSRLSSTVGAIRREVGLVGVRRQSSGSSVKPSSVPAISVSNSISGKNNSIVPSQQADISKTDQPAHTPAVESNMTSMSVSKAFISNQHGSRSRQHVVDHQKAPQTSKEWKPKATQKPIVTSASPHADDSKDLEKEVTDNKLSQVSIQENQSVIIPQHIQVPETDRYRLTFGSFSVELESSRNYVSGRETEELNMESSSRVLVTSPESSSNDAPSGKQTDSMDGQVRNYISGSQASDMVLDYQLPDKKESQSPQNLEYYAEICLAQDISPSDAPSESQQQQCPSELRSFSAYDPQTGYDIPFFRSSLDETTRGQSLPSPQEALSSHTANNIPISTIALVQQQQQQQQLYPQGQVSHFANVMPYRQMAMPVFVPPMAMPGYSSNPAYPHPSNGSSYFLMPGGNSHLNANGVKYGVQQYKPVPACSPTGYGNFSSPTGYAINTSGVVGNVTGFEDSSQMKYKDGNLYVVNPQAETSEIWIQNPREIPGMQATPYYNMTGQTYLPSHMGHAPFNTAAAAQPSQMQYPGMYYPQPTAIANPHHMGSAMGGNVGVGVAAAASGTQIGGVYQQPQLGHLNWPTNF